MKCRNQHSCCRSCFQGDTASTQILLKRSWTAISDLQVTPDKPPFPFGEWENILRSLPVDLEKVYMSTSSRWFASLANDSTTQTQEESGKSKKLVLDSGSWLITWNATRKAILFMSKQQTDELNTYSNCIMDLFALYRGWEQAVIEYNRVVRKEQAAQNAWTLQNFSRFQQFQHAILAGAHELHVGPQHSDWSQKRKKGSKVCNNYNAGICSQTKITCYWCHVCATCKQPGHVLGSRECKKTGWSIQASRTPCFC